MSRSDDGADDAEADYFESDDAESDQDSVEADVLDEADRGIRRRSDRVRRNSTMTRSMNSRLAPAQHERVED